MGLVGIGLVSAGGFGLVVGVMEPMLAIRPVHQLVTFSYFYCSIFLEIDWKWIALLNVNAVLI